MSKGNPPENPVALIAGPTASGKSDLAVDLALALQAAGKPARVINADSAQVYADLQVLSARPSEAEMRGVPHRLFGCWDGAEACSAADWAAAAKKEIAQAHSEGAVPILVGGTGLYIRTLLEGIAPVPPIHEHIREDVRAMETRDAYAALRREDEAYALQLKPADRQRILRGLEVVRSTGQSLLYWHFQKVGGIADQITLVPLILLPEREEIYERCDTRFVRMMDEGAPEEVASLRERGLAEDLPVMRAIGVPQIAGWLDGEWSREDAIDRGQKATRQYAKRQLTWLRHQPPADWMRKHPDNVTNEAIFETLFLN